MLDDLIELALELIFEGAMESVHARRKPLYARLALAGILLVFVCRCDRADGVGRNLDPKLAVDRVGAAALRWARGLVIRLFQKRRGTPHPKTGHDRARASRLSRPPACTAAPRSESRLLPHRAPGCRHRGAGRGIITLTQPAAVRAAQTIAAVPSTPRHSPGLQPQPARGLQVDVRCSLLRLPPDRRSSRRRRSAWRASPGHSARRWRGRCWWPEPGAGNAPEAPSGIPQVPLFGGQAGGDRRVEKSPLMHLVHHGLAGKSGPKASCRTSNPPAPCSQAD